MKYSMEEILKNMVSGILFCIAVTILLMLVRNIMTYARIYEESLLLGGI